MAPYFYETQLAIFTVVCILWLIVDNRINKKARDSEHAPTFSETSRSALTRQYLIVFAIVMGMCCRPCMRACVRVDRRHCCIPGADWLQGPYVYSLYREQYGFPERLVAVLFVTGFVSAGLTAPLVGAWADT